MADLETDLEAAFEAEGYDVAGVSINRRTVKVSLLEEGADADALRSIVTDTVGADAVRGLHVATEAIDGRDQMGTVVSFRQQA